MRCYWRVVALEWEENYEKKFSIAKKSFLSQKLIFINPREILLKKLDIWDWFQIELFLFPLISIFNSNYFL